MKPQLFSIYALRLMILALGLQQLSTQASAKEDIDCTTLAQSDARVEDETGLTASEETNANPLRILLQGRPILYWKKEDQQPEKMRFCAKVALKAPSTNPVLLGGSVYKPKASGALVLPIEWKEETTTLLLTQIDEEGELHPTKIVLKGLSPQQLVEQLFPKVTPQSTEDRFLAWTANAGIQPSFLYYNQTRLSTPYTAGVLTVKAGGNLSLDSKENWTLDAGGYLTLLHLAQSRNDSPRFFGANLRVTRKIGTWESGPGTPLFRVGLGPYYLTTFIPTQAFAFANLGGLQILPTVRFSLPNWGYLGTYFKFATVNEGFVPKSLSNREIAFGLNWSPMKDWMMPWSLSFDFSDLFTEVQTEQVHLNTVNLGVSYRFK